MLVTKNRLAAELAAANERDVKKFLHIGETVNENLVRLDKEIATLKQQFEELYRHLKIHRLYVSETPARYELRESGVLTFSNTSSNTLVNASPFLPVTPAATGKPVKKRRKRRKA